jgi:small nuclear ribonucleoprotein (snRNP)-like protein
MEFEQRKQKPKKIFFNLFFIYKSCSFWFDQSLQKCKSAPSNWQPNTHIPFSFFFCLSFSHLFFLKFHPYHHSPFKTNFRYFTLLISISRSRPGILDLNPHMGKKVRVRFQGGREVVGVLRGFDPMVNIVIDDSIEYLRSDGDEYKANVRQI